MPTSLGISEARNWRIGGGDERLNMRTAMDCAWTLDGAMDNCVYALTLASRYGWLLIDYVTMCMLEIDENMSMHGFESTPSSRFHKLPRIELIRLVTEPIRFHSDFKFNVQNALKIDFSSSKSILMRMILVFKG
ncbi:hypothetical protein PIB30_085267 [Stylosanthes scabra]|uniref:Uncharacterized protein n=1 Tax=Stylosanthes scabra TaxID=79078 RepID=A0ABU6XVE2_9FABA|nr:hypothetical protein [Stylosanthes scabra]